MLASFINNFLEPTAFGIYLIATVTHLKSNRDHSTKLLIVYYALVTTVMAYAALDVHFKWKGSNIWTYDAMALLTAVFLGFYFYRLLKNRTKRRVVVAFVSVYMMYLGLKLFAFSQPRLFDSIGYSIVSASVAAYVFMYFHQLLKNVTEANIFRDFNFWLTSGYLIYFVGSFIIFLSYHHLTTRVIELYNKDERALLTTLWGVHNLLLFVSALSLLTGSIWLNYRKRSVL